MIQLKLSLILYTGARNGGPSSILMFAKDVEVTLTRDTIRDWLITKRYQVTIDSIPFFISLLVRKDDEFLGHAHAHLPTNTSLERYRELARNKWIPKTDSAVTIRSLGHIHFYPDKF